MYGPPRHTPIQSEAERQRERLREHLGVDRRARAHDHVRERGRLRDRAQRRQAAQRRGQRAGLVHLVPVAPLHVHAASGVLALQLRNPGFESRLSHNTKRLSTAPINPNTMIGTGREGKEAADSPCWVLPRR